MLMNHVTIWPTSAGSGVISLVYQYIMRVPISRDIDIWNLISKLNKHF